MCSLGGALSYMVNKSNNGVMNLPGNCPDSCSISETTNYTTSDKVETIETNNFPIKVRTANENPILSEE